MPCHVPALASPAELMLGSDRDTRRCRGDGRGVVCAESDGVVCVGVASISGAVFRAGDMVADVNGGLIMRVAWSGLAWRVVCDIGASRDDGSDVLMVP